MDPNELYHHGVKGMKWGVRKARPSSGSRTTSVSNKKKVKSDNFVKSFITKRNKAKKQKLAVEQAKQEATKAKKKSVSEMTDAELRERISRLEMEKKYKDLLKSNQPQTSKGKKFVASVLEKSGQNIATQATTYVMGRAVNKAFANVFNDPAIVNPKKGQKDK